MATDIDWTGLYQECTLEDCRPVAEVLAIVADTEFYYRATSVGEGMCFALRQASNSELITDHEHRLAREAIEEYLHSLPYTGPYLWQRLSKLNLPHKPCDLIKIYSDWDNRPMPSGD